MTALKSLLRPFYLPFFRLLERLWLLRLAALDPPRYRSLVNDQTFQRQMAKEPVIDFYPPSVTVYNTFKCNFRCEGCTYLLNDDEAFNEGDYMAWDKFEELAQKYAGKIKYMMFSGGEATLHPRFDDMVHRAHELGYILNIATNGSNLLKHKEVWPLFNKLNVSMDSFDYPSFKKNRGASEKVYNNILEGLAWMRDNNVRFRLSYVLSRSRLEEAVRFVEFAKEYKPYQLLFHAMVPHGKESEEALYLRHEDVKSFYRTMLTLRDMPFSVILPHPVPDGELYDKAVCPKMWTTLYVHDKGDIAYCCQLASDPAIGNIFDGYDLNSEKMVQFRQAMIEGKYPTGDCALCQQRFENIAQQTKYSPDENRWVDIPPYLGADIIGPHH